jgi:type I restriction enzyme S subunit
VKPGYKQTEVGVIPKEWEVEPLGELTSYTKGFPFKSSEYQNTGIRVVRVSDTTYDSIKTENPIFVSETSASRYAKWQLKEHDLVVSTVGSKPPMYDSMVGKVILIEKSHENTLLNQNAVLIRDKKCRGYVQKLILNHLRTKRYLLHIEAIYRGNANQASITLKELFQFSIPLPSDGPEQRAIATALSDVDGLLGGLGRLIAKKRDLKQAAMQQLLTGRTRLPDFHGEWEVKRLGDVGEISSAGVDKKIRLNEVSVRLVNYLDVYHKDFIYSKDLNHWVTALPPQAKRCAVQKGDVFFTPTSETRDDIGLSAVAMEDIPDAAYSYHVARLRLREPWDLCFRTYAFKTRAFLDQAETLCDGNGTRYVISQGKFRRMTVQVPPIPEQTAIAEVLKEMDGELAVLEQRRDKTRALKQAMMQELLTGRTRLV